MPTTFAPTTETRPSVTILGRLFRGYGPRDFAVRFWDGSVWPAESGDGPRFTLVLKHPGSVRRMFWPPRPLSTGQAYIYDDFDVEGDMVAFTFLCGHLSRVTPTLSILDRLGLAARILRLPKVVTPRKGRQAAALAGAVHSLERDRQAIGYHYDTSNEFFKLVLGPGMVYTSAVWSGGAEPLEAAQARKLDLLYRKLDLREGDRLLDIGCGWGTPLIHAARDYGARCLGVTISDEQAKWVENRISVAGLGDRCRVESRDYRALDRPGGF